MSNISASFLIKINEARVFFFISLGEYIMWFIFFRY